MVAEFCFKRFRDIIPFQLIRVHILPLLSCLFLYKAIIPSCLLKTSPHSCHLAKLPLSSASTSVPSSDGMPRARFQPSVHQEVSASMTSQNSSGLQQTSRAHSPTSSTVVCPPEDRLPISKGKSPLSNHDILNISLSPTLHPGSTTDVEDFKPFWSSRCREISESLSLPTVTDYPASGSTSSRKSCDSTEATSWFSIRSVPLPKTSSSKTLRVSFTSSVVESIVESTVAEEIKPLTGTPKTSQRAQTQKQTTCVVEGCQTELHPTNLFYCATHLHERSTESPGGMHCDVQTGQEKRHDMCCQDYKRLLLQEACTG